jgi:hypothetical protein
MALVRGAAAVSTTHAHTPAPAPLPPPTHPCALVQAPVWEHTAALAERFQPQIKFAKVDCTDPENEGLCADNHIRAYPTIILFTSVNGEHAHEFYHGGCAVWCGVPRVPARGVRPCPLYA